MNIKGKVGLITGGASGLGRATAEMLVERGAAVALVDLPSQPGEQVAKELSAGGGKAIAAPADVTSGEQMEAAVNAVVEQLGGLHIVVNCAGVGTAGRTISRDGPLPLEQFSRVIAINLIGTFNTIRLAAARIATQEPIDGERGVIVNTASVAAFDGQIGQAAYSASKGGVVGMTLPIARDLASQLIRVMTIAPGIFDTPMLAGLPEDVRAALARDVPHPHRLGQPIEYAALVKAIVENPMLNGETIRLDAALRMPPR
ncbi:MAG TPA: 3-hydroxyacyl-CoA dehydrogenase [Dehalococcoidia bacterium]|nr:3-hydroxyacyl-CoA dehydrogenase [Dehalococcoidia bacterium]